MRLLLIISLLLVAAVPSAGDGMPGAKATRIVFSAAVPVGREKFDRQIFSVEPSGRGLAQLTFGPGAASTPLSSPDGRRIVFIRSGSIWVMRPDGRNQRRIVARGSEPAWAPDSRRLAFVAENGLHVVGATGAGDRLVAARRSEEMHAPAWSPDNRTLAFSRGAWLVVRRNGVERRQARITQIVRTAWSPDGHRIAIERLEPGARSEIHVIDPNGTQALGYGRLPTWSPRRPLLAYADEANLVVADYSAGGGRLLIRETSASSLAWAPDGSRLVLAERLSDRIDIVTLEGRVRTLSAFREPDELTWKTPPAGLRYRRPQAFAQIRGDELRLQASVSAIAADGDQVAFTVCDTIGAWRPEQGRIVSVRSERQLCDWENGLAFGGLALAGDRVAWSAYSGAGTYKQNWVTVAPVAGTAPWTVVAAPRGHTGPDPRGDARSGYPQGDGSLLVFTTWAFCTDLGQPCIVDPPVRDARILEQRIWRVREPSWPGTCPVDSRPPAPYAQVAGRCQDLRSEPGPLRLLDVEKGRIVVSGDNETLVLDEEGRKLSAMPVSALAAHLTGAHVVLQLDGQLRDYDLASGAPPRSWPLRAASRLEDAERGLVALIVDGEVWLLRLMDGATALVGDGAAAAFGDAGLFYTLRGASPWPGRIRFVSFDRLPLR